MPLQTVPLDEHATGTAGPDGTCTVSLGPTLLQRWSISNVGVTSTSSTPTEARVYLGPPGPGGYLAGTYDGTNDSTPLLVRLTAGGRLTVVWSDAEPGSSCTVSIYGTMQVPG